MRIIGGKFKGKVLRAPAKLPVRPTTDQAKEGLFNILRNRYDLRDLRTLELFAGTGNVSYEFASAGVADLTAVDLHPGCVRYMKETFASLGGVAARVVRSDAGKYVQKAREQWDIVFMDPPYGMPGLGGLVDQILDRGLLRPGGLLVLEHPVQENYKAHAGWVEERKYGSSVFSMFASPAD